MAQQIQSSTVEVQATGGAVSAHLARPSGEGRWPGVVVIQEWWGLDPHIKDVTDRYAKAGFVAIAPDLYHGQLTGDPQEAGKLASGLNQGQAVQEISAAARYLKDQPYVSGRVGVVGYCMGGGLSILTACQSPDVDASVIYYGGNPNPIDQVQNLKVPVLGLYGGADGVFPTSVASDLAAALEQHGKTYDIHIYGGAPHGFFCETRDSYRKEAAEDAWQRTTAFFSANLA